MKTLQSKMIPPYRVFTIYALVFIVGIFISSYTAVDFARSWQIILFTIISLIFFTLVNFLLKNRLLTIIAWSFVIIFLALLLYSLFSSRVAEMPKFGDVKIVGMIANNPQVDYEKQRVEISVKNVDGTTISSSEPRIQADLPKIPILEYGDYVELSGNVESSTSSSIDPSYKKFLKKNLVSGIIQNPDSVFKSGKNQSMITHSIRILYMISSYFEQSINSILPEPQASLAAGLVLGIKRNIPADLTDDLNRTGLTHIVALSGYNVTIIMLVFSQLLVQHLGKRKTFWAGVVLVTLFVIMTGAASSVIRAGIFSTLVIYGSTVGRKADQTNMMLLAAIIMILANPFILTNDIGFQLSFLAFAGLIYFSPIISRLFDSSRFRNWPDWIKLPFVETLSAQIAVFPLIIYVFGRFSLIAPIANFLVLWILPLAMLVSFIAGLSGIIYYYLGKILALLAWPVLTYVIKATEIASVLPFSSFEFGQNSIVLVLFLYSCIIIFLFFGIRKFRIIL